MSPPSPCAPSFYSTVVNANRHAMMVALEDWIAEGWFRVVEEKDVERQTRKFVIVGDLAESMAWP